jgi:hypothetical protein
MEKVKFVFTILNLLIILSVLPFQSCSKYTVTTRGSIPADSYYKKKLAATYFWGIINKPHSIMDTTCGKATLSEVKITTHPGYSFLNIITLGIVNLVIIEWKCGKEEPVIGYQP